MKNKISKIIGLIFFIISIGMIILLIYGMVNAYFCGYGTDYPTGNTIEYWPKVYGIEALKIYLKWMFSFDAFGIIFTPIYISAFAYSIIYLRKIRRYNEERKGKQ